MGIDKTFLGTGWAFPPEFHQRAKGVKLVSEGDDIWESLKILLLTSPGERVMYPSYGCGLKGLVFEHMNDSAIAELTDIITRAILFFEPRITLNAVDVNTDELYEGKLLIHLDYTVRMTNARSNMVFPFYFREGTNIRPGGGFPALSQEKG
ncbi:MAG: hypothetical protein GKS05_12105 [Nitrospirales bacterium]|nr:hypothetical protein [Nitrospirales bacterium]